jgi:hypothetical protein
MATVLNVTSQLGYFGGGGAWITMPKGRWKQILDIIQGGTKRTHVFQIIVTVTTESLFLKKKKLLYGKNAMLNVSLLHGYRTDPSALFSGGVGKSPTFTLPTTTHFKNMRSFCTALY